MTEYELLDLLGRFAERPVPSLTGRHVYLWHGAASRLADRVPSSVVATLDVHGVASDLSQSPRSIEAARRLLLKAIRSQLSDTVALDRQQVVIVTGCDLLSRYGVPLQPFFEIASESIAIVLTVSSTETSFHPSEPLPEYVSFSPNAPLDYLRRAVGERSVINTVEE